jgi:hypothetical protein
MGKPWGTQAFIVCAAAPVVGVAALRDIQKKTSEVPKNHHVDDVAQKNLGFG